jgi:F0F1-type ATP synthase beta subunit
MKTVRIIAGGVGKKILVNELIYWSSLHLDGGVVWCGVV